MTDLEDRTRRIVNDAADTAPGPRLDTAQLITAIRRRRRRRTALTAGCLAVALAATATTGMALMTAPRPAAGAPTPNPVIVHGPACGQAVTAPVLPHGPASVTLAIAQVQRHDAAGPPTIQIAVSADRPVLVAPVGQVVLQVLVLRGGIVIDRLGGTLVKDDATPPYVIPYIAMGWQVSPGRPHLESVTAMKHARCPGADWAGIWAAPNDYRLLAIMSMPMITVPGADQPLTRSTDQLIGVEAALSTG
jgi:hypothetical protein